MHTQKKKNISLFSITLVKKQVGRFCRLNLGKHGAVKVLVAQRGDIRVVKAIPIPLRLIIPVHQTGRYIRKVVTRRRRRTLVHDDADELVQSVRFFAVIGAPLLDIQLKRTGHCCRNLGSLQRRERKQLQMNRHDRRQSTELPPALGFGFGVEFLRAVPSGEKNLNQGEG